MEQKADLKEIFQVFIKLGTIGFGGSAAHIAMMHEQVVVKRRWMTEQHFLDLLGATGLIPGSNSIEMAIHIGYIKGGWKASYRWIIFYHAFCFHYWIFCLFIPHLWTASPGAAFHLRHQTGSHSLLF